jgi:uncharacterized protein YceK
LKSKSSSNAHTTIAFNNVTYAQAGLRKSTQPLNSTLGLKVVKKILLVCCILIGLFTSIHETFISKDYIDSTHGTYGYINKVYAGVKYEAGMVSGCFEGTGWEFIICPFGLLLAGGMPFSLVADTFFYPYTYISNQRNEEQHQKCIEDTVKKGREEDVWCTKKY